MYTGTLIKDLMATVERTERSVQLKQYLDEMELRQRFDSPVHEITSEPVYAGAA
jgi:hypothetical protein